MEVRPLGNRVVVQPIKKLEQTLSGVILAHEGTFQPHRGKVLSAGPLTRIPVGSLVYYSRLAGQLVSTGHVILKAEEVLAYESDGKSQV